MCRYLKRFLYLRKYMKNFLTVRPFFLRMQKIIKIGWIVPVPKNSIKKKKNRFGQKLR